MKRIVLFLVVLLIFGWSCSKKKYPQSFSENAPVFYFKANINNALRAFVSEKTGRCDEAHGCDLRRAVALGDGAALK